MTLEELQAEVEKQKKEAEALKAELEKEKKKNEDAQSMIGKQANELGELRKKVTTEPPPDGKAKAKVEEETAEQLEASLSDEQKVAVEEVYTKKLSVEDRARFHNDEEYRKTILRMAREEVVEVPDSPWKTAKAKKAKASDLEDQIRQLFKKEKQKASVPPGPSRRPAQATATEDEAVVAQRRVTGVRSAGVLGTIKMEREGK